MSRTAGHGVALHPLCVIRFLGSFGPKAILCSQILGQISKAERELLEWKFEQKQKGFGCCQGLAPAHIFEVRERPTG
jgi:hypothetical protein